MVCAGVSLHHKTNIVVIKGNLTEARHRHEVLDTEVMPLFQVEHNLVRRFFRI